MPAQQRRDNMPKYGRRVVAVTAPVASRIFDLLATCFDAIKIHPLLRSMWVSFAERRRYETGCPRMRSAIIAPRASRPLVEIPPSLRAMTGLDAPALDSSIELKPVDVADDFDIGVRSTIPAGVTIVRNAPTGAGSRGVHQLNAVARASVGVAAKARWPQYVGSISRYVTYILWLTQRWQPRSPAAVAGGQLMDASSVVTEDRPSYADAAASPAHIQRAWGR